MRLVQNKASKFLQFANNANYTIWICTLYVYALSRTKSVSKQASSELMYEIGYFWCCLLQSGLYMYAIVWCTHLSKCEEKLNFLPKSFRNLSLCNWVYPKSGVVSTVIKRPRKCKNKKLTRDFSNSGKEIEAIEKLCRPFILFARLFIFICCQFIWLHLLMILLAQ